MQHFIYLGLKSNELTALCTTCGANELNQLKERQKEWSQWHDSFEEVENIGKFRGSVIWRTYWNAFGPMCPDPLCSLTMCTIWCKKTPVKILDPLDNAKPGPTPPSLPIENVQEGTWLILLPMFFYGKGGVWRPRFCIIWWVWNSTGVSFYTKWYR